MDTLLHTTLGRVTAVLGPSRCRKEIVGPVKRELARDFPPNVIRREPLERSLQALQGHCRLCGRCKLSRE